MTPKHPILASLGEQQAKDWDGFSLIDGWPVIARVTLYDRDIVFTAQAIYRVRLHE